MCECEALCWSIIKPSTDKKWHVHIPKFPFIWLLRGLLSLSYHPLYLTFVTLAHFTLLKDFGIRKSSSRVWIEITHLNRLKPTSIWMYYIYRKTNYPTAPSYSSLACGFPLTRSGHDNSWSFHGQH